MSDDDREAALRARLRAREREVPQGSFGRMARTAAAAARAAASVAAGRLRGRGGAAEGSEEADGLAGLDLAAVERLVMSLGELKGVAMKIGQLLSYTDDALPPEAKRLLGLLQTQSQPTPFARVAETIRAELGPRGDGLIDRLEKDPVSVASIGQVHRATLPDGTAVAVKVRHPGIEEAIASDFRTAHLGPMFARLMAPGAGATVRQVIAEAEARLREECDYALEATRQERFGALYADDDVVVIPAVHRAWSTRAVLTTTWHTGLDLEALLAREPSAAERDRLGVALFRVYVGTLYRHRLFHADPHPGNYLFPADGRLVLLDFGCVREFDAPTVAALSRLSRAVQGDDGSEIAAALHGLGAAPDGPEGLRVARELLRGFFGPMLEPGPHPITGRTTFAAGEILRDKLALLRLRLPGKLLFLFRIRFGLYAVLARLGTVADWSALEADLAK